MKGRAGIALAVGFGLTAAVPATADASKVFVRGGETLIYNAGKGERNRLTLSSGGNVVTVEDQGATIKVGAGCERLAKHRARCQVAEARARLLALPTARARLKDENDRVEGGVAWIRLDGGPGNDRLRGGFNGDVFVGGTGSDVIVGNGAAFSYDTVSYEGRPDDLRITLAEGTTRNDGGKLDGKPSQRDRLRGITGVIAGAGDDTIFGDDLDNDLIAGLGEDVIRAFGGADGVHLGDGDGGDGSIDNVDCGDDTDFVNDEEFDDVLVGCE